MFANRCYFNKQRDYKAAIELVDRQRQRAGQDYKATIKALMVFMNAAVAFWNSTTDTGEDYTSVIEKKLNTGIEETIKQIDEISLQNLHNEGSQS